jgi:hypothetical protein
MDNTEINILKNYINKLLRFFEGERFDYFNSNKNLIQNVIGQYLRNKYGNIDYSDINTFTSKDTEKIVRHLNTIYNNNIENIHKQSKTAYPSLHPNTPDDEIAGDIPLKVFKRNGGKHGISRRKRSLKRKRKRKTKKMRK